MFIDNIGTYYTHDATGNIMSTYHWYNKDTFDLDELVMYGSSRLGTIGANQYLTDTITRDSLWYALHPIFTNPLCDSINYDATGLKQYEFTNHLGNVLVTLTDKHIPNYANWPFVSYYPEVASAQDYYPFGMIMPGRSHNDYLFRFGFNNKEKDNEIYGIGNFQDYGMRGYDPRRGQFWGVDPLTKKYPELTPFQFASNTPIRAVDLDGKEAIDVIMEEAEGLWADFEAAWPEIEGKIIDAYNAATAANQLPAKTVVKPPVTTAKPVPKNATAPATAKPAQHTAQIQKVDAKKVDKSKEKTHGNTLDDKPAEGYSLRDKKTGDVKKYGETTRGEDKYGEGNQKRYSQKELDENDVEYNKETNGTKKDMHQWQHKKIIEHKENNGQRPDLNKNDY